MKAKQGFKDALPIALGYFAVSFAYGVSSIESGFPAWFPITISLTNYTGTGQFVGTELIKNGVFWVELFTTMIIINIRYTLMSLSLSQRLSKKVTWWQRLIIAFGVTDENFAVAISHNQILNFKYLIVLMTTAFVGWVGGTTCGALLGNVLPQSLLSSFSIALYAMFVAIIIPASIIDWKVAILISLSVAFSCLFYFVKPLAKLGEGWILIIGSILCSIIISLIFPHQNKPLAEVTDEDN